MGGCCDGVGVGVAAGDDDVPPDGVGAADPPGAGVDVTAGEVVAAEGTDAGAFVGRDSPRACGAVDAGRGLSELCGEVLVVRPGAGAWTRPALGGLLALNGA